MPTVQFWFEYGSTYTSHFTKVVAGGVAFHF